MKLLNLLGVGRYPFYLWQYCDCSCPTKNAILAQILLLHSDCHSSSKIYNPPETGRTGLNPSGGKDDSAFHPSEVGEMSSSIINAVQVCRDCADCQELHR